ncbi:acyltransferase [Citrobacter portucalensis]|uniref:acyltransferase n=1 Tax=Citrobacter portucalensis TaxID=1639133 RepID=UPI001BACBE67|nr:acyltransferase [Citrobacter portucalensis]
MHYLIKAFFSILNIIYLYILGRSDKSSISFEMPKIGRGLCVSVHNKAIIDLNNLVARNNLNLFVSRGHLSFEKGCFVNNNCSFNCLERIEVKENTIFGEGVKVYDHDHVINNYFRVSKNEFITSPIIIGSNCWIGSNVVILKGVNIVDNVIIGANSLVNKSISVSGVYVNKNGSLTKIR